MGNTNYFLYDGGNYNSINFLNERPSGELEKRQVSLRFIDKFLVQIVYIAKELGLEESSYCEF